MLNTVHNVDCLAGMMDLESQSIDMVLCDLPYGITRNKWDSEIDLAELWSCWKWVCKPSAAIVLTASMPFTARVVASNFSAFKHEWIWRKNCITGHLNVKRMPMKEHESILVFGFGQPMYNPQGLKPYGKIKKRGHNGANYGKSGSENFQAVTGYPRTVLKFDSSRDKQHPTQKPVDLFEYLIRTYTEPGALVLDCCMGSGTTAVAAINTGRQFVGYETDPGYHRICLRRINEARSALR